ncbi:TSR1 [Auxenochlorella protothecoides x Auxenochlorella symbiontica]
MQCIRQATCRSVNIAALPRASQVAAQCRARPPRRFLGSSTPSLHPSRSRSSGMATLATSTGGSIRQELTSLFGASISSTFPDAGVQPSVAQTNDPKFGDYQCNNAMALFAKCKGKEGAPKNPRAVAEAIVAGLPASDLVESTTLAGPGFINVRLSHAWLGRHVGDMLVSGIGSWAPRGQAGKRVVVDFSSPNVAKEMHVGHLRSTILGDCLCRTLEYCGADVLRLNHIGDWGTQFGMLIQYIADKRPGGLSAAEDEDVADLQVLYRAAKARFDADEGFKAAAREAVTQLQGGRPEYLEVWRRICAASRAEFQRIYDRLGVELQERGESFYNPRLQATVDALVEQGVAVESDGARCVFFEGRDVPLIVQKRDGGFGYASTDMAALHQRLTEERADWIVYLTDAGQAGHFEMIFAAGRRAGYFPKDREVRIDHVGFGLVMGEDGKKFKSRSGDTVRLVELLDEAKARCRTTIKERRPDISEEELEEATSAMGYGAVKYADLKNNRLTNYRFSYNEMLSMQGDTAVYLLYAHARIAAILRKSGKDVAELANSTKITLGNDLEVALALHVSRFSEAVEEMLTDLYPNRLTSYLYDLSGVFNQYYTECQVIGTEEEDSRLLLCEATAVVMRQCFHLLGITPLYRI